MANSSKAKGGKKGTKTKKQPSKSKSRGVKSKLEEPSIASSYLEPEDDDFSVKVDQTPDPPTKGRKRPSDQISKSGGLQDLGVAQSETQPKPKRRATRTRNSVLVEAAAFDEPLVIGKDVHMTDGKNMPPTPPPPSKKAGKSGRKRASTTLRKASITSTASKASLRVTTQDDEALEAALEADLDKPLTDDEAADEPLQIKQPKGRRLTRSKPGSRNDTASVAPTRMNTAVDTIVADGSANAEPPSPVPSNFTSDDSSTNVAPAVSNEPPALVAVPRGKTERAKRNVSRKIAANRQPEPVEIKAAEAQLALATTTITDVPNVQKPRGTKTRQVLRQMPSRNTRASNMSVTQKAEDLASNADSFVLDLQTPEDGSGHETDASVTCQSRGKRAGRKGAITAKKDKTGKQGALMSHSTEDIVVPSASDSAVDEQGHSDLEATDVEDEDVSVSTQTQEPTRTAKATGRPTKGIKSGKEAPVPPPDPAIFSSPPQQEALVPDAALPKQPSVHSTPKQLVSPQSSDAENQPPSSRPSALRPPLSMQSPSRPVSTRVPLAVSTPTRSPNKGTFSRLQTSLPWTAVDIEQIFQGTPNASKKDYPFVLEAGSPKADLTSPEKKLTVEQWIQFNAQRSEERLRSECERIVGRFENEGVRALRTLEGIVCAE